MMDIDGMLSELGRQDPFPIDWKEYESGLLRRLARAESRRRRSAWGFSIAGVAAGVAATLLAVHMMKHDAHSISPENAIARVKHPSPCEDIASADVQAATRFYTRSTGRGSIRATVESDSPPSHTPAETVQPFVRITGKGEIRFSGFSSSNSPEPSYIAVTKPNRKSRVD